MWVLPGEICLQPGHQTPEMAKNGGSGAAGAGWGIDALPRVTFSDRTEQADQHCFFRLTRKSG
jgi:hypothetical protein